MLMLKLTWHEISQDCPLCTFTARTVQNLCLGVYHSICTYIFCSNLTVCCIQLFIFKVFYITCLEDSVEIGKILEGRAIELDQLGVVARRLGVCALLHKLFPALFEFGIVGLALRGNCAARLAVQAGPARRIGCVRHRRAVSTSNLTKH